MSRFIALLALLMIHPGTGKGLAQDEIEAHRKVSDFVDANETCFRCHAESYTSFEDTTTGQALILQMDSNHVISQAEFYG